MKQRSLLDKLEPIDPSTQWTRMPGIDALCPQGKGESSCRAPFCCCYAPDRETADPANEKEAA